MVFSTPCSPSAPSFRRLALALLLLAASLLPHVAQADGINIKSAELETNEEWSYLNAEFEVGLTKALEDALSKGISLNFLVEFELTRYRWYWADESIANVRQNLRLSYQPLTRQYQFSSNAGNKSFNTLTEARNELTRIADWKVLDRSTLKKGITYNAALRMRLDINQLPRPLQIEALGSKDWNLSSDWHRFSITP